eukprot:s1141_g2.t1
MSAAAAAMLALIAWGAGLLRTTRELQKAARWLYNRAARGARLKIWLVPALQRLLEYCRVQHAHVSNAFIDKSDPDCHIDSTLTVTPL